MAFKFSLAQAVEYKPLGRTAGLFTVIRHMPEEHGASRTGNTASKAFKKALSGQCTSSNYNPPI